MPIIIGIIVIVLAIYALYAAAITAMLLIMPAIAAAITFSVTINYWIDETLRTNAVFRRSISLQASNTNVSWQFYSNRDTSLWPTLPLVAATGAALIGLLLEAPWIKPYLSSNDQFIWYVATYGAVGAAASGPFVAASALKNQLNKFLKYQIVVRVSSRFQNETALLRNIIDAEQNLSALYQSVGVHSNETAIDACRDVVLEKAVGYRADAHQELSEYLEGVRGDVAELQQCVEIFEQVKAAFERAKASVIRNGSSTLLSELDRIHAGLRSDLLMQLFETRKWSEIREIFELIIFELDTVRGAAERGEAQVAHDEPSTPNSIPQSLDDAYRILNVNADTRKEVIKKLVDALRMSWHPDLATDEHDRKARHLKIQQINVAWDIVNGRHVSA